MSNLYICSSMDLHGMDLYGVFLDCLDSLSKNEMMWQFCSFYFMFILSKLTEPLAKLDSTALTARLASV